MSLLTVSNLSKTFIRAGGSRIKAVDAVSFSLDAGETLGLVGPSGSGKSTLARMILRLVEPDSGGVAFAGRDFLALRGSALRQARGAIQMVFQDPAMAFNPRATVFGAIADPLRIHAVVPARERARRVADLLDRVGLPAGLAHRAIHDISGGQRQRVAIARALASGPKLIVLDEAVSALDVSVRGKVLELLADLQARDNLAYLFVSHDLALVRVFAHRAAVLDAGRIVEIGPATGVVSNPQSPTARALVSAVPQLLFQV